MSIIVMFDSIGDFCVIVILFFINHPSTPHIYTLSLHDALPICPFPHAAQHLAQAARARERIGERERRAAMAEIERSEEHTSELQSPVHLVCRLLLEKKKCKT